MQRYWVVLLLLSLLVVTVPACGGGAKQEIHTTTPAPISTATIVATPIKTQLSTTPEPLGPVKIGAITSWSGPVAMSGIFLAEPIIKLVEKQVRDMGGILGGREVKVVRYDNYASVAQAQAGVKKLLLHDKVSAIVWGGASGEEIEAVANIAEENRVLFVALGPVLKPEKHKFTVSGTFEKEFIDVTVDFIEKVLKPKTMAILSDDGVSSRNSVGDLKKKVQEGGVEIVSEMYVPTTNTNYVPYLTQINSEKPDMLYLFVSTTERIVSIAKQIAEFEQFGGWGDIKVVTVSSVEAATSLPGVQGWYLWTPWISGLDYPGSLKFVNDYQAMFGKQPQANQVYYYNCIWTAIYAIELAGADTNLEKIAEAVRSGKLEWDTPMGHVHYMPDGRSDLRPVMAQIVEGKLVPVTIPE